MKSLGEILRETVAEMQGASEAISKIAGTKRIGTTVNYRGIELQVAYTWHPAERATHNYPGCPEEFDIQGVYHLGENIINIFSDEQIDELINLI